MVLLSHLLWICLDTEGGGGGCKDMEMCGLAQKDIDRH